VFFLRRRCEFSFSMISRTAHPPNPEESQADFLLPLKEQTLLFGLMGECFFFMVGPGGSRVEGTSSSAVRCTSAVASLLQFPLYSSVPFSPFVRPSGRWCWDLPRRGPLFGGYPSRSLCTMILPMRHPERPRPLFSATARGRGSLSRASKIFFFFFEALGENPLPPSTFMVGKDAPLLIPCLKV